MNRNFFSPPLPLYSTFSNRSIGVEHAVLLHIYSVGDYYYYSRAFMYIPWILKLYFLIKKRALEIGRKKKKKRMCRAHTFFAYGTTFLHDSFAFIASLNIDFLFQFRDWERIILNRIVIFFFKSINLRQIHYE